MLITQDKALKLHFTTNCISLWCKFGQLNAEKQRWNATFDWFTLIVLVFKPFSGKFINFDEIWNVFPLALKLTGVKLLFIFINFYENLSFMSFETGFNYLKWLEAILFEFSAKRWTVLYWAINWFADFSAAAWFKIKTKLLKTFLKL